MENKNRVYSLYTGYEEYEVFFSLPELYEKYKQTCSIAVSPPHVFGFAHEKGLLKKEVRYEGDIFNKETLDEQTLSEIERLIDETIEKNENYISSLVGRGSVTGCFGITSKDRNWAIEREICARSFAFKDFDELDVDLFSYEDEE